MDGGRDQRLRHLRHGQDHEGQRGRRPDRLVPLQRVDGDQVDRRLRPQGRPVVLELDRPRQHRRLRRRGAYTVSETADADYDLRDIACSVTPAPGKYTASGSTAKDLANRKVSIRLGVNEKVDCTVYNKRKTGTIIVKKALIPASDTGKFDLQVDGANVATQVGDGGYGSKTVTTGRTPSVRPART